MVRFEFSLPDHLAQEAQQAGVLTQTRVEEWVRQLVRRQKLDEIFAAVDHASTEDGEYMSPEDVSKELHAMRAERRSR